MSLVYTRAFTRASPESVVSLTSVTVFLGGPMYAHEEHVGPKHEAIVREEALSDTARALTAPDADVAAPPG